MIERNAVTAGLSALVERHLSASGRLWAKEVSFYGRDDPWRAAYRVDYMDASAVHGGCARLHEVESARITVYEVKSCMADLKSGHGLNCIGDSNVIVMPMALYDRLLDAGEFPRGWSVMYPIVDPATGGSDPWAMQEAAMRYAGEVDGWRLSMSQPDPDRGRTVPISQALWAMAYAGFRRWGESGEERL